MSLNSDTLSWFWANQSLFLLHNTMCLADGQQISILVFGFDKPGHKPGQKPGQTRTQTHAKHYITDVVRIYTISDI